MHYRDFQKQAWNYYHAHGRDMPWRINRHRGPRTVTPYKILVSELMLQQTQVPRVIPKYKVFLSAFPSFGALARASRTDVLSHWQGLGYNRRAINLKRAAETVTTHHNGRLPDAYNELITLPGVGPYTARAVQAFAFNIPSVFIETNIRTVFLHHFFHERDQVDDDEIFPLIEHTLDTDNPREWYYALMDYGTYLKQHGYGANQKSKHYTRQSRFEGSNRQQRSRILRYLLSAGADTPTAIARATGYKEADVSRNAAAMAKEGLLEKRGRWYAPAP